MVTQLIKKYDLNIKGVIHIGAHLGQEVPLYIFNDIEHIALVEPQPHIFNQLIQDYKNYPNLKFFNYALGSEEKELEMYIEYANGGYSSSLLKPKRHLEQYPHITFNEKKVVKQKRLDDLELDFNLYNFINIDVQGYELEVFKGGTETLKKIDYIYAEVNRAELYENCCNVHDLESFLSTYNFQRAEINWCGTTWGEAFYIKVKD